MGTAEDSGWTVPSSQNYELHDNVLIDWVNYIRSCTIRNERQFCLLMLSYTSGLFGNPKYYVSTVITGTSSSGKSHLKQKGERLLEHLDIYSPDTGTDKSMLHDSEWGESDLASLGELNQPPEILVEFLKRAHGAEGSFEMKLTRGDVRDGFDAETITKHPLMYAFTYAQFDPDFEMWNRLLKIPAHESESKNRAVYRTAFGCEEIQIGDEDVTYGYPFDSGTRKLTAHMARVKAGPDEAVIDPELRQQTTDLLEPIFNHGRSESNRIYWMAANLIRASALACVNAREVRTLDDGTSAVVVEPQDVANIVRLRPALLATTHEIDDRKRAIHQAIRDKSGAHNEVDGLGPIREWLNESDAAEVKQDQLSKILEDLQANFLVDIHENAGEHGHIYRAYEMDQLGVPKVDQYADVFEDCTDPLTGGPFLDAWNDQRDQTLTSADEMLSKADTETTSAVADSDDDRGGLSQFSDSTSETVDVSPQAAALADACATSVDDVRIRDLTDVPIEAFLGLVDPNDPNLTGVQIDGTLLDPDHEVWDQYDRSDSWVTVESDARRELQDAFDELVSGNVIRFDEILDRDERGRVVDARLAVDRTKIGD